MVRHKNRYMVIEINPDPQAKDNMPIKPTSLSTSIFNKVQQLHGDFGIASIKNGFIAKYCNDKTKIALVKARHGPHRLVNSALPCINYVEKKKVTLTTLYTGATMRQSFKFILNYQQKKVDELCATLKTEEEKTAMREALLNFDSIMEIT